MSQIKILTKEEIKNFDLPPKSNTPERRKYFAIDSKIDEIIERIDNPTNKAGLILMYGYFKISGKFFTADKFHDEDVEYVMDLLDLEKDQINFDKYMDKGYRRHKKLVCEICNYNSFADLDKNIIFSEIDHLIINQTRPRQIFSIFTEFLKSRRIELPNYHTLSSLITNRLNAHEKEILSKFKNLLGDDKKKLLDNLITMPDPKEEDKKDKELPELTRYKLTLLKKPSHSTRPGKIKESIDDFIVIKNLYQEIKPIIDELDLPVKAIRYYDLSTVFRTLNLNRF